MGSQSVVNVERASNAIFSSHRPTHNSSCNKELAQPQLLLIPVALPNVLRTIDALLACPYDKCLCKYNLA